MTLNLDAAIGILSAEPATTVLCCDFDGTLAPIVPDPELASPAEGSIDALVLLASRLQRVAVISGRPLEFLARRLGPDVRGSSDLFGRYGAEHAHPDGTVTLFQQSPTLRTRLDLVTSQVAAELPGTRIEDKGGSVVLHWRERPELEPAIRRLAAALAEELELEVRPGKMVVDLGEIGAPGKGDVVRGLVGEATCGTYLGDDIGDLDAFFALDDFESDGGRAVRIAVDSHEAPDELLEHADLVLPAPAAVGAFLQELASSLSSPRGEDAM